MTWPLLCPYKVPVTLLPREEDDLLVTSEMSWLEEDGGEGREMKLQTGRLTRLMRERKKEESFKLTFTTILEEEEVVEDEEVEHL